MNIQRIICNPLEENCYVVSDASGECVIIDCGVFYQEERTALVDYISRQHLKPVHLLATHGHLDHNFGNALVYEKYKLGVEICTEDQSLVEHLNDQATNLFGIKLDDAQPLPDDCSATVTPSVSATTSCKCCRLPATHTALSSTTAKRSTRHLLATRCSA